MSTQQKTLSETDKASLVVGEDYFADFNFEDLYVDVKQMLKSGVHFGHKRAKKDPHMEPFIWTTRNGISIIDLQATQEKLEEALEFLKGVAVRGKQIIFVGTKKQAKRLVESAAKRCGMPHVSERWLGGTFTNFEVISKRAGYLKKSLEEMGRGEFKKYTKFEQLRKKEELEKLNLKMGGIMTVTELPGALLVMDIKEDSLAVKEAREAGVPIVALADSNVNPLLADYPVPSNDDAVSALRLMLSYFSKAILDGKNLAQHKEKAKESTETKHKEKDN